jgi:hypothetical protein
MQSGPSVGGSAALGDRAELSMPRGSRALRPGELAWIATVPCAIAIFAALILLGPAIGHAFFNPGSDALWPVSAHFISGHPEPTKHGRYLVALLGPVLLTAVVLAGRRRRVTLPTHTIRGLVAASQAATLAFLVATVLGQRNVIFRVTPELWPIFSLRTMAVALTLPALLLATLRVPGLADRIAGLARESRSRRIACLVLAAAFAASWLLVSLDTDRTVGDRDTMYWTMADAFAILDGRTPLVNFHGLYAQLLTYPTAAAMQAFGTDAIVFTITMAVMSGLGLLAVYAVYRRIVQSSLLALALYLPFVASGFLRVALYPSETPGPRFSNVVVAAMWPMRYSGAYLLAWLTARHVDGAAPRRAWLLFLLSGLVLVNDVEFGSAAVAATVAALLCARPPRSRRAAARLVAGAFVGLLGAVALVLLLTVVRAGALPHAGFLLEYLRIFGVLGLVSLPMPVMGLHLALYATFVAAIGVAVVRLVSEDADRLLTGMLAWSGVFGLLAGGYYVGRSDALKLVSLFSAWSLAIGLLTVVVVRALAGRGWRRPRVVEVLVLFGFGLTAYSVAETPDPQSQIARLSAPAPPPTYVPAALRFVAERTTPGQHVAILIASGHRIAYQLGITNVAPYPFLETMVTREQMRTLLDTIRREHAHAVFTPNEQMTLEHAVALIKAGFKPRSTRLDYTEWTDAALARR